MNKKTKIFIISGIIALIVLCAIAFICLKLTVKNVQKNIPTEWLKKYHEKIQESENLMKFLPSCNELDIQIIDLKDNDNIAPTLFIKYDKGYSDEGIMVMRIDEWFTRDVDYTTSMKLFYDIEKDEYKIFLSYEDEDLYKYYSLNDESEYYYVSQYNTDIHQTKYFNDRYIIATDLDDWLEINPSDVRDSRKLMSALLKEKNKNKKISDYLTDEVKKEVSDKIKNPKEEVEYDTYIVKEGDTLKGIADMYNMSVEHVLALNPNIGNEASILYLGQEIKVIKNNKKDSNNIKSNSPLFYYEPEKITVLYNGEKSNDAFTSVTVVNYIPDDTYSKFLESMKKVNTDILEKIVKIEYKPTEKEKERFFIEMKDGNYVYSTLNEFLNINKYNELVKATNNKKGTFHFDTTDRVHFEEFSN